jgi:hypothetical protein
MSNGTCLIVCLVILFGGTAGGVLGLLLFRGAYELFRWMFR